MSILWEMKLSRCLFFPEMDSPALFCRACGSLTDLLASHAASQALTVPKTVNNPICLLYVTLLICSTKERNWSSKISDVRPVESRFLFWLFVRFQHTSVECDISSSPWFFQAEFSEINLASYVNSGCTVDAQVNKGGTKAVR